MSTKRINLDRVNIPLKVAALVFGGFLAWYANHYIVPIGTQVNENTKTIAVQEQYHSEVETRITAAEVKLGELRELLDEKTEARFTSVEAENMRKALEREIDRLEREVRELSKDVYAGGAG